MGLGTHSLSQGATFPGLLWDWGTGQQVRHSLPAAGPLSREVDEQTGPKQPGAGHRETRGRGVSREGGLPGVGGSELVSAPRGGRGPSGGGA